MRVKLLFLLFLFMQCSGQSVVFVQEVTDLFSQKLSSYGEDFEFYYKNPSLSGESKNGCLRVGQALFNESAEVVSYDEKTGELLVEFGNFMVESYSKLKPCQFWCLAKNVQFLDDLDKEIISSDCFVPAISYKQPDGLQDSRCIVLTAPHKEFSLGTRFMRDSDNDTKKEFSVKLFSAEKQAVCKICIPKKKARILRKKTDDTRRKQFIRLLRKVAGNKSQLTPYVWGGGSFTELIENKGFSLQEGKFFNQDVKYWVRKKLKEQPYSGYDCSSLVLRVAQTCGVPYFFKTTSTLFSRGASLGKNDEVKLGDLIVIVGHVAIVSDVENNKLIEAAGYGAGFGRVQEIELEKRLNVSTYSDLLKRYNNNQELEFLYNNGTVATRAPFKIMRLTS